MVHTPPGMLPSSVKEQTVGVVVGDVTPGDRKRQRRPLRAALFRLRRRSDEPTISWVLDGDSVLMGDSVALVRVTEDIKVDFWETQTPDMLATMGSDMDEHERVERVIQSLPVESFSQHVAIRALDRERRICKVVGGMSVNRVDSETVELGIWLVPAHRGWGAGTEALGLAADYWSDRLFNVRVVTAADNVAMAACAEKAGFHETTSLDRRLPNGDVIPAVQFDRPRKPASVVTAA